MEAKKPTKSRSWPLSLLVILIPAIVFGIRIATSLHQPFTSGGDVGIAEITVHQAIHGGVALGPYSRYGWHHPGPAYFYEFAPFYWLSGESSRSLFLGAWVLNSTCALVAVWLIRRIIGESIARLSALILLGYFAALTSQSLIDAWNPSVLRTPVMLMLVAGALACTGSYGSLAVAYVAGSYAMQTHIGTAPITIGALAVATIACIWRRHTLNQATQGKIAAHQRADQPVTPPPPRAMVPLIIGAAAMIIMWAAPVIQQFSAHKGNVSQIEQFYSNPPAADGPIGHPLHKSAVAIADYATVVPFGGLMSTDTGEAPINDNHRQREVLIGLVGLIGIAAGIVGWRRNRGLAWMGFFGSGALLIAVLSASRVIGPLLGYLFWWTSLLSFLPIVGALGLIFTGLNAWRSRTTGWLTSSSAIYLGKAITIVSLVIVCGFFTKYVYAADTISYGESPNSVAVAKQIEQYVNHDKKTTFNLDINTFAGFEDDTVATQLEKDGYSFRMTKPLDLWNGTAKELSSTGPTFHFGIPSQQPSELPGRAFALTDKIRVSVS